MRKVFVLILLFPSLSIGVAAAVRVRQAGSASDTLWLYLQPDTQVLEEVAVVAKKLMN